ncbi:MAG TPA: PASTA domain-containing protein, partial [Micromonosporaceae bacterium]|nr:PASTA domain-containing protein [Micromonosporaceae bacterium]
IREEPDPLPADLPDNVRRLVERALCKDPAQRFPDGAALLAAIDDVLSGRPPVPPARTRTAVMPVPSGAAFATPAKPAAVSGGRAAVRALVGALAVLVVLAVAVLLVRASTDTPADAGSTPETTEPAAVELVAAEFIGRPVRDVQAELVARGLQVGVVPVETADLPAGQVLSVDPAGSVAPGAAVTVSYAVPPVVVPEPQQGGGNGNDGGGNGNGNGNGRGNDKGDEDD